MPIHEFQCRTCLREFEELVFGDDLPSCPYCGSARAERLISRPCAYRKGGGDAMFSGDAGGASSGGGCAGCSGGSCATCGH